MERVQQVVLVWRKVYSLLRKAAPRVSLAVTCITLVEAIVGILVLYAIKVLVDAICVELTAPEEGDLRKIVYALTITGFVFLCAAFFKSISGILRMRQGLLVSDYVDREIHGRAVAVGLKYYESPEYYDSLERAREGGSRRPAQIVSNAVITFREAVTIAGIFVLISSIELRLVPALVIPITIALVVRLYFARKLFDWRMSRAQRERRAAYLDMVMTKAFHAKDLRINGMGPFLLDSYSEIRKHLRQDEIGIEQARLWSEFAVATLGAVVFIFASAWLLYQSLDGSRAIGDVVLFVLLLRRAESSGNELVGNASRIVDDHLYLNRLFDFLSVPTQTSAQMEHYTVPSSPSIGLEVRNASFRYEGSAVNTLHDVSIALRPGQITALVGENGSGKTTLIKLLCRLYDPTHGVVTLDGIDVRKFAPHEFRKLLSVVFQDYAIYADTAASNIRFGDIDRDSSFASVQSAAKNAGASTFIERLPNKYNTPLTKLFDDGQDLSIGQWQRIALARALYAESKFLILDEPTSAMDPKAEFDLFENFKSRIGGRAALVISHRLSTVRQADYIYVMSEGSIVEKGTHADLIDLNGKYAKLFERQARFYK